MKGFDFGRYSSLRTVLERFVSEFDDDQQDREPFKFLAAELAISWLKTGEHCNFGTHWLLQKTIPPTPFGLYLIAIIQLNVKALPDNDFSNIWRRGRKGEPKKRNCIWGNESLQVVERAKTLAAARLSLITDAQTFLDTKLPPDFELGLQLAFSGIVLAKSGELLDSLAGIVLYGDFVPVLEDYRELKKSQKNAMVASIPNKIDIAKTEIFEKFVDFAIDSGVDDSLGKLDLFLKQQKDRRFRITGKNYPYIERSTCGSGSDIKIQFKFVFGKAKQETLGADALNKRIGFYREKRELQSSLDEHRQQRGVITT